MVPQRPFLTSLPEWQALERHHRDIEPKHLSALFAEDPGRAERFTLDAAGVRLDYSKHRITSETLALLVKLAGACRLREHIDAMFAG
jgi:glucose-6-phosphate isomerase